MINSEECDVHDAVFLFCCCVMQVAASKASTIIVLHPDGTTSANAEAIKVSVAMSLTALGGTGTQRVVVQGVLSLALWFGTLRCKSHPRVLFGSQRLPHAKLCHGVLLSTSLGDGALPLRICVGFCRAICWHQHCPVFSGGNHTQCWGSLHHTAF